VTDQVLAEERPGRTDTGADTGTPPRPAGRARRLLSHEWTLAALAAVLSSIAMTWPTVRNLHSLPFDIWDPSLQSWEVSWVGWSMTHDIGRLWDTNTFITDRYALAYSDTLFGYLPAGLIGSGPQAAVIRYNILFLLAFALAFFGAYLLARQLGSRVAGAALAGAAYAYAPWHWTQGSHLHILSNGGIALSLAMLARGHGYSLRHGYRPALTRPGWALAGWLVAAWQVSLGFGLGMPFAYLIGFIVVVSLLVWLRRRPTFGRRLLFFDLAGMAAFGAVGGLMAYPYFKVLALYHSNGRPLEEIIFYSPPLRGFFAAPPMSWLWGDLQEPLRQTFMEAGGWESILLPGFTLYALALLGLFLSAWPWRRRLLLAVVLAGVFWVAMGLRAPNTFIYRALWQHLPGWAGIRTPGRLVVFVTLLLAVLAAGAVTALGDRLAPWLRRRPAIGRPLLALGMILPIGGALLEGIATINPAPVPVAPAAFAQAADPVLVLPTDWRDDELMMLWSTDGFPRMVNGQSGFIPPGSVRMREVTKSFPDATSAQYLRDLGVRTVVVLRHPAAAQLGLTPDGAVPPERFYTGSLDGLGITREETPDAVVYHLDG
jgi:hypothetical protein